MRFRIPFTVASLDKLKKRARFFKKYIQTRKDTKLQYYLNSADLDITREEYLAICSTGFFVTFIATFVVTSTVLLFLHVANMFLLSFFFALMAGGFVTFSRFVYPKVYDTRKQHEIERNLIPALQDMLIQLNSGIPLFTILVNISSSDYGTLSKEFQKIVRKIHGGFSEVEVLEEAGDKNSSLFFRRALWQISNGMRAGGDISIVIAESIRSLDEEQLIQIQIYGNKLNPAIMFFMLISVIIPALAVTFLTVIASLVSLPEFVTMLIFISMLVFILLVQFMFLGVIKSIRPSLL